MGLQAESLSTRRTRLRQATNDSHQRVDDLIVQWGCLENHGRYNAYLLATLRARGPLEARLDQSRADRVFPAWPTRRLAPVLREDLLDLSLTPSPPEPAWSEALGLTPAAILGVLYVLEGSALGAQILKRRAAAIGLTATHGARHLNQQTVSPGLWPAFLHCLETYALTSDGEDECVQTAVATFEAFEREYRSMG